MVLLEWVMAASFPEIKPNPPLDPQAGQLRAFDSARSGAKVGLAVLLALCGALLKKSLKGGLIVVGGLNLGGGFDPVYNAASAAELAVEKGATTLLIPISARKQLNELSDDMAMKLRQLQENKQPLLSRERRDTNKVFL